MLIVGDDNSGSMPAEVVAELSEKLGDIQTEEVSVRGRRVLVIGGGISGRHLALAALAHLAADAVLVAGPDPGPPSDTLRGEALRLAVPEPILVSFTDGEERKGKGKRRRQWESPYANIGKQRRGFDHKQLTRQRQHRGGR
ncbi:MAG: hypothetical protein JST01_03395 [Cyanobacteria bacterium SZAS TMP-1]|nr:hypothetical protein [Cyanobacteria bacterium SZAS TMP-1]